MIVIGLRDLVLWCHLIKTATHRIFAFSNTSGKFDIVYPFRDEFFLYVDKTENIVHFLVQ